MGIPGRRRQAAGTGFTLVELVLTVALLLLLVGAAVFNFNSAQRGIQLEEGAGQLESLFRFARAQAAGSGRRVQIQFAAEPTPGSTNAAPAQPGLLQVLWEPDPLGEPGKFVPLPEAAAFADQLNESVKFEAPLEFEQGGATNTAPITAEATSAATGATTEGLGTPGSSPHPAPILFYPDGSSDSAELILVSQDSEDRRRVRLSLAGLTGTVRRKWLAAENEFGVPAEEPAPETAPTSDSPGLNPKPSRAP